MLDMTARGRLTNRRPEGRLSVIARDSEEDALEPAAAGQVAVDLLHLDPRGLVQREASDPGPEGDQCQARGAELVGLDQRASRRAADDLIAHLNPNAFPELVRDLAAYRAAIAAEQGVIPTSCDPQIW